MFTPVRTTCPDRFGEIVRGAAIGDDILDRGGVVHGQCQVIGQGEGRLGRQARAVKRETAVAGAVEDDGTGRANRIGQGDVRAIVLKGAGAQRERSLPIGPLVMVVPLTVLAPTTRVPLDKVVPPV